MANSLTYLDKTYTDEEIVSGSLSRAESLSMCDLSVDTAEFTIRPVLHRGFYTDDHYLFYTTEQDNSHLRFFTTEQHNLNGEIVQNAKLTEKIDSATVALWYAQSKERIGENLYKLSASSVIGLLTQYQHNGGIYDGVSDTAKASVVIADICKSIPVYLDSNLGNTKLKGWLPIATARDNLQQVLLALCANARVDNTGVIRIENLANSAEYNIPAGNILSANAAVVESAPITSVVVVEHQYTKGDSTTLYESTDPTVEQTITFSEPVDPDSLVASGYNIVERGANFVKLSDGVGTVTGTPYRHLTRELTVSVTNAEAKNIAKIENATLVNENNSTLVAGMLADYYKCRKSVNVKVVGNLVRPGDVVNIYNPWDKTMGVATVASAKTDLSNTTASSISALSAFVPYQTTGYEAKTVRKTEASSSWTVPAGVTDVICVLIGGGSGGGKGSNGDDAKGTTQIYDYQSINSENISGEGSPGAGGAGGVGGKGGRYLRVRLTVSPGDVISYTCGVGGEAGTNGTDTTIIGEDFSYSTANGIYDPNGYTDSDGTIYCADGSQGLRGADGGKCGAPTPNIANDGENGNSAGENSGGLGGIGIRIGSTSQETPGLWFESDYMNLAGAGGGGAAYDSAGERADPNPDPDKDRKPTFQVITPGDQYNIIGRGGNGGNGGVGETAANYGCGGNGGNGGGGGGAGGGYAYSRNGSSGTTYTGQIGIYLVGGDGGAGGAGSSGGNGCVIFKYRVPTQ